MKRDKNPETEAKKDEEGLMTIKLKLMDSERN